MRIYYCYKCGDRTEVPKNTVEQCKCGRVFGSTGKISDLINMRNTLAKTTTIEFSETTFDESVEKMRR